MRLASTDPIAAARDGGHGEAVVFATRREQLHGVARLHRERFGEPIADDDRGGIVPKIVEAAVENLGAQIRRRRMSGGVDPEQGDGGGFKAGARAEQPAQDGRAGGDVRELPAHPHDSAGIDDAFEITAMRVRIRVFRRDQHPAGRGFETGEERERSVAAEIRIHEILREPGGLGLRANENGDAENDAGAAQNEGALAMPEKAQRNVKRRRHR